ncbi:MAG: pentapeptide repeat-containing protein [Nostoc sp.]|uniref:pentapeptide repeat-containing protein n=1 Tax=Nostoc sp. TaxID=1180 RepID=UPI002FFB0D7F
MTNNQNQPRDYDAVLGGQSPSPVDGAVLGGIEGVKNCLSSPMIEVRIAALSEALKYGDAGLDVLIQTLLDESILVQCFAYQLLQQRVEPQVIQALQAYNLWNLEPRFNEYQGYKENNVTQFANQQVVEFNPNISIPEPVDNDIEEFFRHRALLDETIKRYEAGERNFTAVELSNTAIYYSFMDVNFIGANLQKSFFWSLYLFNTSFTDANLEGTGFRASLINCNFSNANLREARLSGAVLTRTNFSGADLRSADLRSTKLIGCNLRDANLTDIKIDERTIFVSTIMPDGSMRTDSTKQIFDAQKLRQCFYGELQDNFQGIIMHNADLSGIDLHGTSMYPVNMSKACFSNINFRDANLSGVDFSSSSFIGCDFRGANLESADMDDAQFICTDFRGAKARFYGYLNINTILSDGRFIPVRRMESPK